VTIQSFDFRTLTYLHSKYPAVSTAALVEANDPRTFEKQIEELGFTPSIYSPNFQLVTDQLIRTCHNSGMKIIPWTVNETEKFQELRKMGVDGIITDYPDMKQ
jgi:glycerophosphoryl diester phosphodiesterase